MERKEPDSIVVFTELPYKQILCSSDTDQCGCVQSNGAWNYRIITNQDTHGRDNGRSFILPTPSRFRPTRPL